VLTKRFLLQRKTALRDVEIDTLTLAYYAGSAISGAGAGVETKANKVLVQGLRGRSPRKGTMSGILTM
jgi:hypothetical protein